MTERREIEGYVVFARAESSASDVPRWYPKEFPKDPHWPTAECTWSLYQAMKSGHCGDEFRLMIGLGKITRTHTPAEVDNTQLVRVGDGPPKKYIKGAPLEE